MTTKICEKGEDAPPTFPGKWVSASNNFMKFSELHIEKNILRALRESGYQQPTPIQEQAIPPVLAGRDLLGCAQTGTGKTCAFAVPIIQRLQQHRNANPNTKQPATRALVLTPTRELALQIYENVCQYARYTSCQAAVIYGGVSQVPQVEILTHGVDILIATPGRLWDLMGQGIVHLEHIESFVLDEADRMLDMGFFPDVKRIIPYLPNTRQTLLFSATMPKEIAALADSLLHNPVSISIAPPATPVETIQQWVYLVEKPEKRELLARIIRQYSAHQTLVFTRTKHGADRVARELNRMGIAAKALHSDKSQNQRQAALTDFRHGKIAVLVATDIAARGIDITELPLVINFDLPNIPDTYIHRIGRTGRAGQQGTAVSFCDRSERPYLQAIEQMMGKTIPVAEEVPHVPHELERHNGSRRSFHVSLYSERASAEAVAADARRLKANRQRGKTGVLSAASSTSVSSTASAPSALRQPFSSSHSVSRPSAHSSRPSAVPSRSATVPSHSSTRQPSHYSAQTPLATEPRISTVQQRYGSSTQGKGRRVIENEPRFDAHTPTRTEALSSEAMARIRKKVETALAARQTASMRPTSSHPSSGNPSGLRAAHKSTKTLGTHSQPNNTHNTPAVKKKLRAYRSRRAK